VSAVKTILVLESQVPFVHGGAEILVRQLTGALRDHGYDAEIVSVPFRDSPHDEIFAQAMSWRQLDVSRAGDRSVDMVIATKFPTYFARHPNKVLWLTHQYRAAYELCGTRYSDFRHIEQDVGLRKRLVSIDSRMLDECRGRFTIAKTVSARLAKYSGLAAEALYHPPKLARRLRPGPYGDYIICVTRLERIKRVDLTIEAFRNVDPPLRLLIAGEGSERSDLQALIEDLQLHDRVSMLGRVEEEALLDLYAGALGVLFTPFDEDYGYVTLEAFLSKKPVVTASDSGGTLEFVVDGVNGFVCEPTPHALAAAINRLAVNRELAAALGEHGYRQARSITWDGVVERLVGSVLSPLPAMTA
jgi:glycosyltransferase involved in cell wall biosynthesis